MGNELKGEPVVVLVVEDDPDHAELISRSLEDHRVASRVFHVSDGESALDYLFRRGRFSDAVHSPRPHVILLDLRIPRIDGLEVLKEVKKSEMLRHIPVVVLTTSDDEADLTAAYDNHANSYLVKPATFGGFTRMMDDLGFYWLSWNRKPEAKQSGMNTEV
jgi:CheY-like chemotaxis protein